MSNPRYDLLATSVPGGNSFTTSIAVLNYSQAAIQVIWSGLDAANGTIRLRASNDNSYFQNLTNYPVTMTVSASNHMFNTYQIGYGFMQIYYDPGSNTTGTLTLKTTLKAFG